MEQMNYLSPWIQTTNRCNLRCSYCFVEKQDVDMKPETYEMMVSQFLNYLNNKEVSYIKLRIAGGEPLLVFDKWKEPVKRFLDNSGEKGGAEILTNLVKIPDGFINYVSKYCNLGVNVSLDSVTMSKPFSNGKSSSEYVMKNISKIKNIKDIFIMTVLTENGKHLPDLADYVTQNNFKWEIQLNKFYEKDIDKEAVIGNLEKVIDTFNTKGLSVRKNLMFNFCDFGTSRICEAGQKMFYINSEGDVYNCQMQEHGIPLTNINNGDLVEKLGNNKVKRPYLSKCNGCNIEDFCHGDCPTNNTLARRKYFCDIMKGYFMHAGKNVIKFAKSKPATAKEPACVRGHY